MVVEHQLRLDRRIVTDRDRTIRFPLAQCLGGLDHGEGSARAVTGDAGVGAFEVVLDAYMTENVVGERAQEPHRIDRAGELAAEGLEVAVRLAHQRKVLILRIVCAAARADVDAASIGKRRRVIGTQRVAVRREARAVDGAARGVEPEHVGATDQLVQLPVLDQCARIEVCHFRGHRHRPPRGVPLLYGSDRRAPLA